VLGPGANMTEPGTESQRAGGVADGDVPSIALVGNPNTGKTTLFNRLTGLRHKTSNFAGTTLEARTGRASVGEARLELIDLPGAYSLELEQPEARVCRDVLGGEARGVPVPDGMLVVLDATNLGRNLMLAGEGLRRRLPTVVGVNMIDLARRQGLHVDAAKLSARLGCPVVLISARTGEGVEELKGRLLEVARAGVVPTQTPPGDEVGLRAWAEEVYAFAASGGAGDERLARNTDRADMVLTHPVLGLLAFAVVMGLMFAGIFWLASFPMGWIEGIFAFANGGLREVLPAGAVRDLLTDGVLAGVGATVVFLPQIALLFFLISLLEDTGYLARAAFVADRLLRPFGLPGHSFVPLLSSHACAIPGVLATRTIPDRRERLATILVAPFMTCSARLPVYVLLIGLIVAGLSKSGAVSHPALVGGLLFVGCYALGIVAGVLSALLARRTILRGAARPMALELPSYKLPSVRGALITAYDRSLMFIKKAGTAILAVSVVLWWLGAFPHAGPTAEAQALRAQAAVVAGEDAGVLVARADRIDARHAKSESFLGRIGRAAEPVFAPIGADWQLTIGILASFAAREVFVGTMSVVIAGAEGGDDAGEQGRVRDELAGAVRADGRTLVFSRGTCWSMLVFYVLAMQCLPTLVVTAREAGGVRWAVLQFAWMSLLAYGGAMVVLWLVGGK